MQEAAHNARAWPFEEARKLLARYAHTKPPSHILFETGYGPSGLPHIGTFGEVVRTAMVRHAFSLLSDQPSRLITFSDDMDGLRKIPDNIPNPQTMLPHLGKPLTAIPDPFGTHESFGHHNNAKLRGFLDQFGFSYEFYSATEIYKSGRFDTVLLAVLENYAAICEIIRPTLGKERQQTYSPFLPLCPDTGQVLQVPILNHDPEAGTVTYQQPGRNKSVETLVTGGRCKLQWKCDWAMRWVALGIDYEMAGKDLIDSITLSSKICGILGGIPPEGFNYELFLDEQGHKISKSKGNGLTIEDWLRYAPPESLALFMYHAPRKAKRLYFDIIPRQVDDYYAYLTKAETDEPANLIENPAWHIHAGTLPPASNHPISFSMLLNLACACNAEDKSVLLGFVRRYIPDFSPVTHPWLDQLADHAVAYFHDFVKPKKQARPPRPEERPILKELAEALRNLPANADAETIQTLFFNIGKIHANTYPSLKEWFQALYQILLGQNQGPRLGSFVVLYGPAETLTLIDQALLKDADTRDQNANGPLNAC